MRLFYVTLNTDGEARKIGRDLLDKQLAVCVNWFPITCMYRWEGETLEEPETVLIVKTQPGYRSAIEAVIRQHIDYTNFIGEFAPHNVNDGFAAWLNATVPLVPEGGPGADPKAEAGGE